MRERANIEKEKCQPRGFPTNDEIWRVNKRNLQTLKTYVCEKERKSSKAGDNETLIPSNLHQLKTNMQNH
jgi:hypothetical protein